MEVLGGARLQGIFHESPLSTVKSHTVLVKCRCVSMVVCSSPCGQAHSWIVNRQPASAIVVLSTS